MSLRSNCARLSLDAVQVRAPATIDSLPQSDVGRGQHDSIDSDIWRRGRQERPKLRSGPGNRWSRQFSVPEVVANCMLNFSAIFWSTRPPSRKQAGAGFRSRMGETANNSLDPGAGCLVPVGSPVCQAPTGWSPGCGAKAHHVPLDALRLPPCGVRIPSTKPLPGTVSAGPRVGLRFVEQLRRRGTGPPWDSGGCATDLGSPPHKQLWFPSPLHLHVIFRQKVRLEVAALVSGFRNRLDKSLRVTPKGPVTPWCEKRGTRPGRRNTV